MMSWLHEILLSPEATHFGAVLGNDDPEARERYRAWLAERGDERAELFAIEAQLLRDDFSEREPAIERAKEILGRSRRTRDWWRVVMRTASIRNCGSAGSESRPIRFAYECPRTWESLTPTGADDTRHCSTCEKLVHLCRSREEAEDRARRGECITITASTWTSLAREATSGYTGRPDPVAIWADRVFPDERTDR